MCSSTKLTGKDDFSIYKLISESVYRAYWIMTVYGSDFNVLIPPLDVLLMFGQSLEPDIAEILRL